MNVKAVVDRVTAEGQKNTTVHVLTGQREHAEAIAKQAERQFGHDRVELMRTNTHETTIPESPVVVGNWTNYGFAYARQGLVVDDHSEELDRITAGATALIVEVPEEERRVPCVISGSAGILASVTLLGVDRQVQEDR